MRLAAGLVARVALAAALGATGARHAAAAPAQIAAHAGARPFAHASAGAVEFGSRCCVTVHGYQRPSGGADGVRAPGDSVPRAWWSPFASAVLPGAGQATLRQDRFVVYLAIEAYSWLRFSADAREGRRQRAAYRELARGVARSVFSDSTPVGDFPYYEHMEHFLESGRYDVIAGGQLDPETDSTTYNGSLWLRARATFWTDPNVAPPIDSKPYADAVAYYGARAYGPEYRWSWRNAQLEQDVFRRTIDRSNDAFRRALQDLGIIIANHTLSMVDAYVTVRLRYLRPESPGAGIEISLPW